MNLKASFAIAKSKNEMTMKEIADRAGLNESTITRMKKSNTAPLSTIKKIADVYGMSVSEFLLLGE
jgi:transcriptional regulator with XRE-family HTH domain